MFTVEKKIIKNKCWVCKGKKCKTCHGTGSWEESIYYHYYTGKDGKQYCIDSDFIK
jgi:hypothetical protein